MFILLYANCVVLYCVSFDVVVGNKRYLILSYTDHMIVFTLLVTENHKNLFWQCLDKAYLLETVYVVCPVQLIQLARHQCTIHNSRDAVTVSAAVATRSRADCSSMESHTSLKHSPSIQMRM